MRETGTSGSELHGRPCWLYVAYYPPLFLGLLSFPRFLQTRAEARQFWLDVATVFLGGLMLLWSALIAPLATGERLGRPWPWRLAIGYPLGDLILLFGMSVVASRRRADSVAAGLPVLLTAGLTLTVVNDSISSVMSLTSAYRSGGTFDLIPLFAWLFFGASAEAGSISAGPPRRLGSRKGPPESDSGSGRRRSLAPYVAVVLGYGTLFFIRPVLSGLTPIAVVVGAVRADDRGARAPVLRRHSRTSASPLSKPPARSEARFTLPRAKLLRHHRGRGRRTRRSGT